MTGGHGMGRERSFGTARTGITAPYGCTKFSSRRGRARYGRDHHDRDRTKFKFSRHDRRHDRLGSSIPYSPIPLGGGIGE